MLGLSLSGPHSSVPSQPRRPMRSRGVTYRDRECFMSLYQTYVRPHLKYAVAAWSPWTLGDKDVLEAVQRRAVRMVTDLRGK